MGNTGGWGAYRPIYEMMAFWANILGTTEIDSTNLPDVNPNDGSTVRLDVYSSPNHDLEMWYYLVIGGGHDWPGAWGGSNDFDANTVIWEFVSRYDLDGLIDCGGGPEIYCQTSPNSNGFGALIAWSGSSSVSSNDLVLEVFAAAVNRPGIFYYGPDQVQVPFGDGYRCVGGALKRLPVVFTDGWGAAFHAVDLTDPTLPTGSIAAGETWNFQFWYRDTAAGGSGFNFSNGLRVPFLP